MTAQITLSEHRIQSQAVLALRENRVLFYAVPNGGLRFLSTAGQLWQEGVSRGVPDLIIVDSPRFGGGHIHFGGHFVGAAIEVKKLGGKATPEQLQWLSALAARGWFTKVCVGLDDLMQTLQELGYVPPAKLGEIYETPAKTAPTRQKRAKKT